MQETKESLLFKQNLSNLFSGGNGNSEISECRGLYSHLLWVIFVVAVVIKLDSNDLISHH